VRAGVRLALDMGARRIGVARCDREAIMAVPLDTIDASTPEWTNRVQALVAEYEPIELVIGNPVSLRGTAEWASASVRERAQQLQQALPDLPIRLVDERLTTATALRQLREAGRDSRAAKSRVDAAAAVGILEFALEVERRSGAPAGEAL
jgi:putative Holliday junction resolvase